MATQTIQFGTEATRIAWVIGIGWDANPFEPLGSAFDDVFHAGHRLDVVDDGGLAEHTFDGRKGRLDPRPSAFAFQTLNQSRLLAADVGRGAAMHVNVQRIAATQNVLA